MERWIPRSLGSLGELFRTVDGYLSTTDLPEKVRFAVRLATEELFTNLVRHNHGGRSDVLVSIEREPGRLVVKLRDYDVEPFDPAGVAPFDPSLPLAERSPGGLGVHLVKSLFDELRYEHSDRVLEVTAIKHLEEGDVRDQAAGGRKSPSRGPT